MIDVVFVLEDVCDFDEDVLVIWVVSERDCFFDLIVGFVF